jgi:hypothetical protein
LSPSDNYRSQSPLGEACCYKQFAPKGVKSLQHPFG